MQISTFHQIYWYCKIQESPEIYSPTELKFEVCNKQIVKLSNVHPPRLRDCWQLPPCPRVQKIPRFFGSFEVLRRKTFVVISRLETRMSIRLMEIWNGFMEQYNSPAAGNLLLLTILFPVHKLHTELVSKLIGIKSQRRVAAFFVFWHFDKKEQSV